MFGQADLKQILDYDQNTGVFRWATRKCQRKRAGEIAGSVSNKGYVMIGIDYKKYSAHRLAWLYVHGDWPAGEIDHINRDRTDNRISNLRVATRRQQIENSERPMGWDSKVTCSWSDRKLG
jgi:hypothetical protein